MLKKKLKKKRFIEKHKFYYYIYIAYRNICFRLIEFYSWRCFPTINIIMWNFSQQTDNICTFAYSNIRVYTNVWFMTVTQINNILLAFLYNIERVYFSIIKYKFFHITSYYVIYNRMLRSMAWYEYLQHKLLDLKK